MAERWLPAVSTKGVLLSKRSCWINYCIRSNTFSPIWKWLVESALIITLYNSISYLDGDWSLVCPFQVRSESSVCLNRDFVLWLEMRKGGIGGWRCVWLDERFERLGMRHFNLWPITPLFAWIRASKGTINLAG